MSVVLIGLTGLCVFSAVLSYAAENYLVAAFCAGVAAMLISMMVETHK